MGRRQASSLAAIVSKHIDAIGGIENAEYMRQPESFRSRSLEYLSALYQGANKAEANRIATEVIPPITVAVEPAANEVTIIDGRHRMITARNAGATHIAADVKIYDEEGNYKTWHGRVLIRR